jgi:hypothetical protein
MATKFKDINVGDKVTVEGVVVLKEGGLSVPMDVVSVSFGGFAVAHVNLSLIATHTPAPRPFKIGDPVRRRCDVGVCQLLAWFEGKAVLGHSGTNGRPTVLLADKSELLHVDPAPQELAKERKRIEAWVNVYPGDYPFCVYRSQRLADNNPGNRIACLHVVGYEGDGL